MTSHGAIRYKTIPLFSMKTVMLFGIYCLT